MKAYKQTGRKANVERFESPETGFSGWRVKLQSNRAIPTPAVSNGQVYVGGGFGSYDFYSLYADSGDMVWHRRTTDDGPTAAVIMGRYMAYNTESCTLEVVDTVSGEPVWHEWLGDPLLAQPAIAGKRVFMVYPKAGNHYLGAFDIGCGKSLWEVRLDHDVITAPVAVEGMVFLATFDGTVWAVNPETGQIEWTRQMRATSAPWVCDGEVYVAHREDGQEGAKQPGDPRRTRRHTATDDPREQTSKIDARSGEHKASYDSKEALYLSRRWGEDRKASYHAADAGVGFTHAPGAAKLDKASGLLGEHLVSRAWRFQGSRPVVVDGLLYDTTGDRLEARDPKTGEIKWSWSDADSLPGERRLTPPAVANGRVWAGTWDGRIISWEAGSGEIRWAVSVGAPCHWQPVISNGRVFAGLEDGSLLSFATGDSLDDGWPMWGGGPGHNGQAHTN